MLPQVRGIRPKFPQDYRAPSSTAVSRCRARLRSSTTTARPHQVPHRLLGRRRHPHRRQLPGPARPSRASRRESRRSVLTLSEPPFGTSDGATTWHATPIEVSSRYRS
jgi:hypothetical protein